MFINERDLISDEDAQNNMQETRDKKFNKRNVFVSHVIC